MASTLAIGSVVTTVLAVLRASISLTTYVGLRVYPDANGMAPQTPAYPYVQVESLSETPFNTMGPSVDDPKWGSEGQVGVRIGSQTRSDAQASSIASVVKQVLDGRALNVTGYTSADVSFSNLVPIQDFAGGVTTREWLMIFDFMVHQS
jgi:hypothetical protein